MRSEWSFVTVTTLGVAEAPRQHFVLAFWLPFQFHPVSNFHGLPTSEMPGLHGLARALTRERRASEKTTERGIVFNDTLLAHIAFGSWLSVGRIRTWCDSRMMTN